VAIANIINNVAVAQTEGNSDPFATPYIHGSTDVCDRQEFQTSTP
jgi:hypothetical protein